jgi:resuscitation-promoting factor RpfA
MTSLVSITARRMYGAARLLCWCLGVATAAALMWLAAALFGGMTAAAGTPLLSGTASGAARHRTEPATLTTGQPRDPAEPAGTTPRVEPASMATPLATPPTGTATSAAPRLHGARISTVEAPAPASDVWDRVAQCESGGRWNISTGNGHHGGLQFTPSTWKAYGGGKYASSANQATREQQIEIAKKVLAGQGPGAWPHCGRKAGLTRANGGAATGSGTGAAKRAPSPAPKATTKAGTEASRPKYTPTDKATNTHDKARDKKVSKYRGTSKAHHDKATNQLKSSRNPQSKAQRNVTKDAVVVRSGDTLSGLAASHHVKGGWRALYEANKDKLDNPHTIRPNQKLALPRS